VRKLAIAIALCGSLFCAPAHAKTFVAVLWPMFGPLPAIGLVELTAEIKMMPDVEVETYVHQAWPSLVEDLGRLPPGTHTVVIGYSLGANSTVFVANNAKYVDLIIALQPSMLSWNPPLTGKVGRMIEVYNPNPWLTWGGMGSKKLVGENIEYIENSDSHPGAQFNSEFRNLAKTEIAKFAAQDRLEKDRPETAQAGIGEPLDLAPPAAATKLGFAEEQPAHPQNDAAAKDPRPAAQTDKPNPPKPAAPDRVARGQPNGKPEARAAARDGPSNPPTAGDSSGKRELMLADLTAYARRTYAIAHTGEDSGGQAPSAADGDLIAALSK